ncbi:serine protease [Alcanivorax sp. DP30]|uniref:serine protease n=1 Tax=Alcanivorax sp. DP30 TaxID=2606217 RepID=UPI00136D49A1|nr:serine protease [Alcanivorax sp. DP30]MZR63369.1 serine protease [Alcanivorax sp. DP30]
MRVILMMVVAVLMAGCNPVGGDRDQFGCLGSGGYQWCPALQECVRSWELAEERGLEQTQEAVDRFCAGADD